MFTAIRSFVLAVVVVTYGTVTRAADTFAVDPVHSSVSFMISHAGISFIHGRFNDFSGKFTIDKTDPSKSSFAMSIKIDSVDTNNKKRDEHLQANDYFDAKQFPTMSFESTKVKAVDGGFDVTGDMTMHGVKKEISFKLKGSDKTVEFPKGTQRVGFSTAFVVKRSEFGMKTALDSLGDDVQVNIGVQAAK